MAQLRRDYQEFAVRDTVVAAVAPDDAKALRAYWQRRRLPFVGLADPDHRVAELYAQEVSILRLGRMPAMFVVDRDGTVRYEHHGASMHDIPPTAEVLRVLDELASEAPRPERTSPLRK